MSDHALLSPSGASRWMACPPSARLEELLPDSSGEFAREGTLAHAIGENRLLAWLNPEEVDEYDFELNKLVTDPLYAPDMEDYIDEYVTFVVEQFEEAKKQTSDAFIAVEQRFDLTEYIPDSFGTSDATIIADGIMHTVDLKYGKGVRVSCVENKQMMLYALGALKEFDWMYDIHTVRMTVFQPRMGNVSTWEISVADLKVWAETELKVKAKQAFDGDGDYAPGEHCRFCRAKAKCAALAEHNLKLAAYEFRQADFLTDEETAEILSRAGLFKNWITAVEEHAFKQALEGKKWPGYKLVEGRSVRVYSDQDAVAETLVKAGIEESIIYERKLLGITAMEKAITKKKFEALLTPLILKPQGKPTLVPESDKRAEYTPNAGALDDFAEFIES